MIAKNVATAIAGLSLSACTSLSVSEVQPWKPSTQTVSGATGGQPAGTLPIPSSNRSRTLPAGFAYRLPAAIIAPSAYLAIKACKIDENAEKMLLDHKAKDPKPVTEISFAVGGSIATAQVPDQTILIDYRSMQAFLKTSSLSIGLYPNGTLKSVNASMEDESPDAIAALAAAAGSIALLSTGAPGAAVGLAGAAAAAGNKGDANPANNKIKRVPVTYAACTAETLVLLADRKTASDARSAATDRLAAIAAKAAKLDAAKDQAALEKMTADAAKESATIDDTSGKIADVDMQLRVPFDLVYALDASGHEATTVTALPDTGQVKPSLLLNGINLRPNRLTAFIAQHVVTAHGEVSDVNKSRFSARPCLYDAAIAKPRPSETCSNLDAVQGVAAGMARVTIKGRSASMLPDESDHRPDSGILVTTRKAKDDIPGSDVAANKGIIYVQPVKLTVEMRAPPTTPTFMSKETLIKSVEVSVPQLGQYLALPLKADFGERAELQATFAEDGSLLTATFASPKSMGKAIANSIKNATDVALTAQTGREDRKAKLAKTKADTLASLVAAQASAKTLTSADPLADLNAELAKANAQAALAEAQVRIKAATEKLTIP